MTNAILQNLDLTSVSATVARDADPSPDAVDQTPARRSNVAIVDQDRPKCAAALSLVQTRVSRTAANAQRSVLDVAIAKMPMFRVSTVSSATAPRARPADTRADTARCVPFETVTHLEPGKFDSHGMEWVADDVS